MHFNAKITSGNAIKSTSDPNQIYGFYTHQDPGANGDSFEHYISLQAGIYTFKVHGLKIGWGEALLDWYLNSTKIVSLQNWGTPGAYNTVQATTGIVVAKGQYALKGVVNGTSGSLYIAVLNKYWFVKTA